VEALNDNTLVVLLDHSVIKIPIASTQQLSTAVMLSNMSATREFLDDKGNETVIEMDVCTRKLLIY
jgi:hypothetical protein